VAAGLAALDLIDGIEPYPALEALAARLSSDLTSILAERGIPCTVNRSGSLLSLFFAEGPVVDYETARGADHEAYARFFHAMLDRGVYLPPSGYEGWFLSATHGEKEAGEILDAARAAISRW